MVQLPVEAVLPEIVACLRQEASVVVVAPPGAGKTTRVPGALVDAGLVGDRRLLMLEPRRVAARAAARQIARIRRARVGGEVGYRVRFEDRTSRDSKIVVLTEGLLTRMLQDDPELSDTAVVILDEIHERSVHADLALAFLREVQDSLRPDLKIVAMSATLDPGPIARFLGDCPVVRSEGKIFPVETRFLDKPDDRGVVEQAVSGSRRALRETEGDVLVFLPGAREIERTKEKLQDYAQGVDLRPLYGALPAAAQDAAIAPGSRRKVVLATNLAESSLTIEGVHTVVDAGLEKIVRHDPSRGLDRLDTVRIPRDSADQRRGRAGRTGPGVCYRLWTAAEDRRLMERATPEIARVDLAPVLLEVLAWSGTDPQTFGFFEAPPASAIETSLSLLRLLGAVEADSHRLTEHGRRLRRLPLHPRIAAVLVAAYDAGVVEEGALWAALVSERDLLRRDADLHVSSDSDLAVRADLFREIERSGFSRSLADRAGVDLRSARQIAKVEAQLVGVARRALGASPPSQGDRDAALRRAALAGFPDRVGKRRAPDSDRFVLVGGRGARLSPRSGVVGEALIVALQMTVANKGPDSLVTVASAVDSSWLDVREVRHVRFDEARLAADAVVERRHGDLVLSRKKDPAGDVLRMAEVLAEAAAADLHRALDLGDDFDTLRRRVDFLRRELPELGFEPLDDDALIAALPALCAGRRSFAELKKADLVGALQSVLTHQQRQSLQREAPMRIDVGKGRPWKLRYDNEGPPVLSIKLQKLFGVTETPRVARGRVPIKVELLAPNFRPVQVTQDLGSFWKNTYREVRKQLRARYPRHDWPENP